MELNLQKKTYSLLFFLILAFLLANYLPFLNNTLLLDDPAIVERAVKSSFLDTLLPSKSFLSGRHAKNAVVKNGMFRPLAAASLKVDSIFFGKQYWLWRLENILIHLANLFLLWQVLLILYPKISVRERQGLKGLLVLLAIHPVFHHAVLWISCRPDLLGFNFSVAGLLLYLKNRPKIGSFLFWLALLYFIAGGFCKETYLIVPLALVLLAKNKKSKSLWVFLGIPLLLRSLVYLDQKYLVPGMARQTYLTFQNSHGFWDVIPGHLLDLLIAPFSFDRFAYMRVKGLWGSSWPLSLGLLLACGILLAALLQKKNSWFRYGAWIYLIFFIPFLGAALLGNGFLYHFGSWNAYPLMLSLAVLGIPLFKQKYFLAGMLVLGVFSQLSNFAVIPKFQDYYRFTHWQVQRIPENYDLARMLLFTASNENHLQEGKQFYEEIIANPRLSYLGTIDRPGFEREGLSRIENLGGVIYGKLKEYEAAKTIFQRQLALDNRPEFRLDAKWRLYRLGSLTKHPEEMARWKEEFSSDFKQVKGEIEIDKFLPLLRDMNLFAE